MKRKYNNTDNGNMRICFSERLRITLFHCAVQLILSLILIGGILFIFCLMKKYGIYREFTNVYTINATIINALLALSIFTSIISVQLSVNVIMKFVKAYENIKNGNYSVRLSFRKSKILQKTAVQFNDMALQLQKTEMLSSDFIGNFSHEMKTPVASIHGFAGLLKNDDIPTDTRNAYLDIIIQESESLSHLAERILLLSKLGEQTEIEQKTVVNVSEQLRIAVASAYSKWAEKNISIFSEENNYFTLGDAEMLNQVWTNLISNAIKFSPEGGKIKITASAEDGFIFIAIENQGNPIPEENHTDIFKKFYQCDKDSRNGGNGLGLPIAKQIVQLHGGSICVKKSDAKSTVFEVTLREAPSHK